MSRKAQRRATRRHRRRAAARGLVRLEVAASHADAGLIRGLAEMLRRDTDAAQALRAILSQGVGKADVQTASDVFSSDLPDEAFAGIFEAPRQGDPGP